MENNQAIQLRGWTRRNRILVILSIPVFILAGIIFIGNFFYPSVYEFIYKGTKLDLKSDAEIISDFQSQKDELNGIIGQIQQIEKERQLLIIQRDTNNKLIDEKLKNNDINKNNKDLKESEKKRLIDEKSKNNRSFFDTLDAKRKEIDQILKKMGYQGHSHYSSNGKIVINQKSFFYSENHFFSSFKSSYTMQKGLIFFEENLQPDPQFVIDNLDQYSSGNIKFNTQRFADKFGKMETVYVHIEGNWYLFLKVIYNPSYNPNDF